ncbi:MAG: hypothetical protein JST68_22365 [Bacteroidetes bacterium]|nr:hypothetical protein [Bacteroidota bacterium]
MDNLNLYLEYHQWANNKVLEKLALVPKEDWSRDVGGSFPTLRELYQHVLGGDYRWLMRWKGVPIAEIPSHFIVDDYDSLVALWRPILEETLVVGAAFLAGKAEQPINFITARGLDVTQPFWQTLYQVVNHGTYHRGQVTNALRILGREAVSTDIFLFFREKA